MSYISLNDLKYSVLDDCEAIAFFTSAEDAQAFLEYKQSTAEEFQRLELGYYTDTHVDIEIRGS